MNEHRGAFVGCVLVGTSVSTKNGPARGACTKISTVKQKKTRTATAAAVAAAADSTSTLTGLAFILDDDTLVVMLMLMLMLRWWYWWVGSRENTYFVYVAVYL